MKTVTLSIRDFAVPVPRVGSIESLSGYGRAQEDGIEIHLRVQKQRKKHYADEYQAEVPISAFFERHGYRFEVTGRADGLFTKGTPRIEEIKSCFNLIELEKKLITGNHPYLLQLQTYGYFYFLNHQVKPDLSFHLVSTRSWASKDLEYTLDTDQYETWLELRLSELVAEARRSEERAKKREKTASEFPFPFANPRPGQMDLIATVQKAMQEKARLLLQAPTGLGKTVGVLYPVLQEALFRGQRVIYVTPKNSQHSVAEDAVERFQACGAKIRSLTVTAKSKICFKNEPLCNPDYCEFAKDYYTKVESAQLREVLAKKRKLTSRVFQSVGESYQVCPFELQMEAAKDAEVIICDYNYVFGPRTAFGDLSANSVGETGQPNLVIDEAHNLYPRSLGYYSPELSTYTLERMRPAIRELPDRFRSEAESLLNTCILTIKNCRPERANKSEEIDPPASTFLEQDAELRSFLSRYLESDIEIQPRDIVLRLCFYWSEFTAALEFVSHPRRPEFFTTYRILPGDGGAVKITCCDASEMLKDKYERFDQVVAFSATLKPFDYYLKLSGLSEETTKKAEFHSPFPKENRKLILIKEISTKYSDRERNYPKIAEAIHKIVAVKAGNYFAFFPSFEFMERVLDHYRPPNGFDTYQQRRDMNATQIEMILTQLKDQTVSKVVFAVQGGVFSEGVDYPGKMIIGAFVIGPPLPSFDLEREKMRAYYEENYQAGFDYAYTYPAMAKAVQAAGRVVRSESDVGLIVLMDNRFLHTNYADSMPSDWFQENPTELLSKGILKEVSDFWKEHEDTQ